MVRHIQVNQSAFAEAPLVQTRDDLFHRLSHGCQAALLKATNPVRALAYDVAMPVGTAHMLWWNCRFHRYDFIVVFNQVNELL